MAAKLLHGQSKPRTPEFRAWCNMNERCLNERHRNYAQYGGRGISVCERWLKFENFYADMGARPAAGYSLDRIDTKGNYDPANCRWATSREQGQNRATVKLSPADAREIRMLFRRGYSQAELAAEFNVSQPQISKVINNKQWR